MKKKSFGESLASAEHSDSVVGRPFPKSGGFTEALINHRGYISDKWEQYLPIYENALESILASNEPVNLLEIGVQNGGSLEIWSKILPPGSSIIGLDIDELCLTLSFPENVTVKIVDAADASLLNKALGDTEFDIIVDDGSHISREIIKTFENCFDRLKPGGTYVVEDLHASYRASHEGGFRKLGAAIEYFKLLIDVVNSDHFESDALQTVGADEILTLNNFGRQIAKISFFDSVCLIQKFNTPKNEPFRRLIAGQAALVKDDLSLWPVSELRNLLLTESAAAHLSYKLVDELASAREIVGRTAVFAEQATVSKQQLALSASQFENDKQTIVQLEIALQDLQKKLRLATDQKEYHGEVINQHELVIAKLKAKVELATHQSENDKQFILDLIKGVRETETAKRELSERHAKMVSESESVENFLSNLNAQIDNLNGELRIAGQRRVLAEQQAEMAERNFSAIYSSTVWQATQPLRALARLLPSGIRRRVRQAMKVGRWTINGQLISRIRLRREFFKNLVESREHSQQLVSLHSSIPVVDDVAQVESSRGSRLVVDAIAHVMAAPDPYELWRKANVLDRDTLILQRRISRSLLVQPIFSIVVPIFRTPVDVFSEMVESVLVQSYPKWELCLVVVDEGNLTRDLSAAAFQAAKKDPRIRVQLTTENLGISGNSNLALEMVVGDWVALLDHDDLLSSDALFEFAKAINGHPAAGFIYSDKDSVDRTATKHFHPLMKPSWSPEIMLNANYLTHLCAMRSDILRKIGGWDFQTDGAQDWDIFLRTIGECENVVHVPRVLYHWRWIETSVAAGGFDAKPYAAAGQIRALTKYLPTAGWGASTPHFDGPYIRVTWDKSFRPSVSIVLIDGSSKDSHLIVADSRVEMLYVSGLDLSKAVDDAICGASGDIIVLLDAGYTPRNENWFDELVGPLLNPDIAIVGGLVLDSRDHVVDYGVYFEDGLAYPSFRGENEFYWGPAGAVRWYRNASAAPGGALSFRRSLWSKLDGFSAFVAPHARPDILFTAEAVKLGTGRLMLNPFASFISHSGSRHWERRSEASSQGGFDARFPLRDPFVNTNLTVMPSGGTPVFRPPSSLARQTGHDFDAEARWVAHTYNVASWEISLSRATCALAPGSCLATAIWIVPDFSSAFYGGINTILRTANHMFESYGVTSNFAVLGGPSSDKIRARIAQAFPRLAAAARVIIFQSPETMPDLGAADAGICTLWTTAFALLKMTNVKKKFYFVQDWEPLFYPAGTISAAVEATYRFGFHAICNTTSLASSYSELGGKADFFNPAIDPLIFHPEGRSHRLSDEPFVLVCYGRPGTPRNCFEVLSAALRELKRKYGTGIDIITAGAEWKPEDYQLGGVLRNLGLLPYADTGALYRNADAGLVAMATRHPSYLPFEWMACGTAVVTNRNPHTAWLLRHEENCLICELTQSDIVDAVSRLIDDRALRDALAESAYERVCLDHGDWKVSCDRIYETMQMSVAAATSNRRS